jgi:hypothetical protein
VSRQLWLTGRRVYWQCHTTEPLALNAANSRCSVNAPRGDWQAPQQGDIWLTPVGAYGAHRSIVPKHGGMEPPWQPNLYRDTQSLPPGSKFPDYTCAAATPRSHRADVIATLWGTRVAFMYLLGNRPACGCRSLGDCNILCEDPSAVCRCGSSTPPRNHD